MEEPALTIEGLGFRYPGQPEPVLREVSLVVQPRMRFGLFGPNGAGKTTLLSLMTGLLKPSSGRVSVLGQKAGTASLKKRMGYIPQDLAFYPELSAMENLGFFGALYGLKGPGLENKSAELLRAFGLGDTGRKPVREFSGGMKRRPNLAIGLMHDPEILFLDEPTVGVDVQSRNAIVHYLLDLNRKGTTLVYTSHHLKEAEELCTDIILLDEGRIVTGGSLAALLGKQPQGGGLEGLFLSMTGHDYRD